MRSIASVALTSLLCVLAGTWIALLVLLAILAAAPDNPQQRIMWYSPCRDTVRYISMRNGTVSIGQIDGWEIQGFDDNWLVPLCHTTAMYYARTGWAKATPPQAFKIADMFAVARVPVFKNITIQAVVSTVWWVPVVLGCGCVLLASWRLRRPIQRHRRRRRGQCPVCGYDLAGNQSGVCPECGGVAASSARQTGAAGSR